MNIVLTKSEQDILLSKITTKEIYEDVIAYLEEKCFPFPFTDKEMNQIAAKARKDAAAGKGTSIDDMRNLYPRV
jgi:predicted transposase YbfD/YdcC